MNKKLVALSISIVLAIIDLATKSIIEAKMPLMHSFKVIPGVVNFTHITNTGIAFGLFQTYGNTTKTLILIAIGVVALIVILSLYWETAPDNTLQLSALTFILGGALGNLVDRIIDGEVTDFIDIYYKNFHWHTFNLADVFITIGILLLLVENLPFATKQQRKNFEKSNS